MLYLTGYLSRGTNTIHSGLAEDSVSSGSLDWLQVKEKLWFRNPECKPLHTTIHPAQAAAETQLLLELRLSSSWSMCPTRLCLCFLLTSSYLTPTHTICIHAYVYPPPWSDQGDFRKTYRIYIHTYTHVGFPGDSDSKESTCSARDTGSIPELEDPLQKGVATHSSVLAWEILWTEEPGGLQSVGLQRVGHS